MGLNVGNCPRCGRLYAKSLRDVCPACLKELDAQYDTCAAYLRENRGCTTADLSDATGISVKQITKFIREGRISISNMPNLSYPCDSCGAPIREQTICDTCRQRLAKAVNNAFEDERRTQEQRKADNQATYNIQDRLKDRLR